MKLLCNPEIFDRIIQVIKWLYFEMINDFSMDIDLLKQKISTKMQRKYLFIWAEILILNEVYDNKWWNSPKSRVEDAYNYVNQIL